MATHTSAGSLLPENRSGRFWGGLRWRNRALYTRVVIVNTSVLLAAVLALVLTPATISFPVAGEQGVVLAIGVALIVLANAMLIRVNFRGLTAVVKRMETIDVLRPQERLPETGGKDSRALINGFNAMLERLESERRDSTRRTLSALENERRRLGHELHDEIGQRLTGSLLQLGRLAEDLPEEVRPLVAAVQEEQRSTLDVVGALAWQLRPAILDDLGLVSALEALTSSLAAHAPARIDVHLPEVLASPLPPDTELAVYRIAQEALTNAVRHSGAARIGLSLEDDGGRLLLEVEDDGCGIPPLGFDGSGIRGMRERALLIEGRLEVEGRQGSGTLVSMVVPCPGRP